MLDWYYTERYGSTNLRCGTCRNLEYSTESEIEERRQENLAVAAQQSGSWAGVRSACAFSMWFHTKKIRRQVCLEPDL